VWLGDLFHLNHRIFIIIMAPLADAYMIDCLYGDAILYLIFR
jgi:hypothetical protein